MTGISRSRIYVYISRETDPFPRPLRLGPNSVGWLKSEVQEWLDASPVELVKREPGSRWVDLQIEGRGLAAFCSSPVSFARLSVKVSAIRNCMRA